MYIPLPPSRNPLNDRPPNVARRVVLMLLVAAGLLAWFHSDLRHRLPPETIFAAPLLVLFLVVPWKWREPVTPPRRRRTKGRPRGPIS